MSVPNLFLNANRRFEESAFMTALSRQMEHVKTCCCCFDLKMGCKLIVLFETICSLCQIFYAGREIVVKKDLSLAPVWIDAQITQHDKEFNFFMGLISFFSALLLLTGAVYQRKICVLLWVYVTLLVTVIFMFYTLFLDCIPDLMLFDILSVGLHAYFIVIALAYYMQMQRAQGTDDDFQVLFTASEA